MKRLLVALLFAGLMAPTVVLAGGIVTNANQSAAYIRMPAQDATLGIDAVYYNPAGLAFLQDGFYISINNQYIVQNRKINSTFPSMNRTEFKGGIVSPVFPGIYLAYKKNKVAFSFGFNPIGGGGSAKFDNGLPSFEQRVVSSNIPASLTTAGIPTSGYRLDAEFEGRSMMYGFQVNGSYKINEMLSVSLGVRYIIAKNFYKGNMAIFIDPNQPAFGALYDGTNMVSAPTFFTDAANTLNGWAAGATSFVTGLQPIVTGGGGTVSLTNGATVGLTATQIAQIQGLLGAAGLTPAQIGAINIQTAQGTLSAAAPVFTAKANTMTGYAAETSDKVADVEQNGTGISPIIGFDLKLSEKLNIGFRYEHKATIKVKNKTKRDDVNLWPDKLETPNDMPTTISLGAQYKVTEKVSLSGGIHYYLDKTASYGKVESRDADGIPTFYDNDKVIDNNFLEIALGCEYAINEKILVSAGYLRTQTGVNEKYQSDLSHSLSTNTIGGGLKYSLNEKMAINLGCMYSMYLKNTKTFTSPVNFDETYNRSALVLAIGVDLKF